MEDTSNEEDPNVNPQLTEKLLVKSEYAFHIDSAKKKFDNVIATALKNTKA